MASQDYLIAIALIEQNLVRAMPLGGKEVKDNLVEPENFKKLGEEVILNLLLRVFQRSDEGALKRVSEDKGLLLVPAGENVIRIVPPLIISHREIKILLDKLNSIFEEI